MATNTKNQYQAFLDSRLGKYLVNNLLVDMNAAISNAKRLQGTSAAKGGGGKEVASWKKDTAFLKDLRGDLVAEVKAIKSGTAKSLKALDANHLQSSEVLEWVEQRNHVYQMVADAQFEAKIAAFLPLLGLLTSEGAKSIVQQRKLEHLQLF